MTTRHLPIGPSGRRRAVGAVAAWLVLSAWATGAGRQESPPAPQAERPEGFELVKKTSLAGTAPWTDTGLGVKEGEEYYFEAEGTVSLQKDNPVAACGPEGLNLRTMQQPVADQNLGCLIGRVVERTDVVEDKDKEEKTVRQFGPLFFIGKQLRMPMPATGRLLLGVNENVTKDNDGGFAVSIYKKKARP